MKKETHMKSTKLATIALFLGLALTTGVSHACSFDTDCQPGSVCLKASGALYGVCAGGLFPGNKYDEEPVRSLTDPNETYGNTCSFDIDCGPGSKCVKSSGAIEGVCMRGW